jgi:hypothetical protein
MGNVHPTNEHANSIQGFFPPPLNPIDPPTSITLQGGVKGAPEFMQTNQLTFKNIQRKFTKLFFNQREGRIFNQAILTPNFSNNTQIILQKLLINIALALSIGHSFTLKVKCIVNIHIFDSKINPIVWDANRQETFTLDPGTYVFENNRTITNFTRLRLNPDEVIIGVSLNSIPDVQILIINSFNNTFNVDFSGDVTSNYFTRSWA